MINIIINEEFSTLISQDIIVQTVQAVFDHQNTESTSSLSVVIENDETLRDLNFQFRSIDTPTDVLSFPSGEMDPEEDGIYLGDVIISYPRAIEQAITANHTSDCEIRLLIVHGVLHLLGYDHSAAEEQEAMWKAQDEILKPFNCKSPQIT